VLALFASGKADWDHEGKISVSDCGGRGRKRRGTFNQRQHLRIENGGIGTRRNLAAQDVAPSINAEGEAGHTRGPMRLRRMTFEPIEPGD
jgi:hypothetical protein